MLRKDCLLLPALLALAACSGGTESTIFGELERQISSEVGSNDYYVELEEIFETETDALELQDVASLPLSGSAEYRGFMELTFLSPDNPGSQTDLRGDLSLGVDFAANEVTGNVSEWVAVTPTRVIVLEGELDLSPGVMDRDRSPDDGVAFITELGGTLANAEEGQVELELFMGGGFISNEDFVRGAVFGEGTFIGTEPGDSLTVDVEDGDFIAARN